MKILHYIDENNLSWAWPWVQLLNELKKNIEIIIVCRPNGSLSNILKQNNLDVIEYKPLFTALPFMNSGFKKIIKKIKPDLIHTRLSSAASIAGFFGKKLNIPVVATIDKFPKRKYYKNVNYIIPCSKAVENHMISIGFKKENMTVIYNALNIKYYITKKLNYNNKIFFLGMGRFVDWKGFDILIKAFNEFLNEINNPEKFFLYLAGDGPELNNLKTLTHNLNLENKIFFLGFVKNVKSILKKSDIYIHPSYGKEAFGLSLLEAMASGLAVIASDNGGIPEILNDNQGLLFKCLDCHGLAQCMKNAVKNKSELSLKAQNRALDFDVSKISQQIINVYKSILQPSQLH